ncbi:MAG: preprotein translocase subunit SecA [Salibacteraceae bacterium]
MFGSLVNTIKKIIGNKSEKDIKAINHLVIAINEEYKKLSSISNDDLRQKTKDFQKTIQDSISSQNEQIASLKEKAESESTTVLEKEKLYDQIDKLDKEITGLIENTLNDLLPEAFAVFKETARRFTENTSVEVTATDNDKEIASQKANVTIVGDKSVWANTWDAAGTPVTWDMIHYDVQLIGGIVLHQGKIAEMMTGEGKTLVGTLPMYLNALSGRGVHLVTVNDYLAKRDSEWMAPMFEFHGLSIACIDKTRPNSPERKAAYAADITYGTNNEFGFDYLRDNMASTVAELVQPPHNYAIVDEVDSVLIDEARTPLIISGPTPKGDVHHFDELKPKIELLVAEQKKLVNGLFTEAKRKLAADENSHPDKKERANIIEEGKLALFRCYRGLPKSKSLIKFLSEPGMKLMLQETENFYLQDQGKNMHIVDDALFFVIEEKNNSVDLTDKGLELISKSVENKEFFLMPDLSSLLSSIDESDASESEKLEKKEAVMDDYTIKTERLHTIDKLLKAYCMFEKDVEYVLMDNQVKIVDEQTGRIMDGRRYSDGLHQAIEAKEKVKIEASTQTYATVTLQNYFRMYNKLSGMTGTAETEAGEFWEIYKLDVVVIPTNRPLLRDDKEDLVYKTAREKYNAVIDEVVKLRDQGRPVLVGTTSVEVSELLGRMLNMRKVEHQVLNAKLHQKEAEVVQHAGEPGTVTIATNMAGRGTDIKLTQSTKDAGGLAIIGTERHESRRIDRQLRGRSGRQGDPGSSQFFVSLEDNLMRLFGSERIAKMMDRMGHEEGEAIQHKMISNSIERAQKKVEENNFGIRKNLLEYDDVMNKQREVIYKRRRNALYGTRLKIDIANSIFDNIESMVIDYSNTKDYNGFKLEALATLHVDIPVTETEFLNNKKEDVIEKVYEATLSSYFSRHKEMATKAFPVIKNVFEDPNAHYENIVVPFTDGKKSMQVVANLEKSYNSEGLELIDSLEKGVSLAMIDQYWKEHLRAMDDLRQSVRNAVYEQKDPLLIYKFESFKLFKEMVGQIGREGVSFLVKANLPQQENTQVQAAPAPRIKVKQLQERKDELPSAATGGQQYHDPSENKAPEKKTPIVRTERVIGRNDKVTIKHMQTGETKSVKFKQAEPLLKSGMWRLEA